MGLVVASFRRNTAPTPKQCTVSVSSSPSSRLLAALGLIRSSWRKDFLQCFLRFRVVVHRVGVAHPPVVVFLAVLRQILLHIPPLANLATLHFHLFAENTFYTSLQCFRSVNHHQIPPLQI